METTNATTRSGADSGALPLQGKDHHGRDKVKITVDGKGREVAAGNYLVSAFKQLLGIDPSYELEMVVDRRLTPIEDSATIDVKECQIFLSHVRCGASS